MIQNEELVRMIKAKQNVQDNMLLLYEQNRPFIYQQVKKYSADVEMVDLMQEAFISLHMAVNGYDESMGVKFTSYFSFWLKQGAKKLVYGESDLTMNGNMQELVKRYKQFSNEMVMQLGKKPTDEEYCQKLKLKHSELEYIRSIIDKSMVLRLDAPVGTDYDINQNLIDTVPDSIDYFELVLDNVRQEELKRIIDEALSELPDADEELIRELYQNEHTMKEYADSKGITPEAVRKKKNRCLRDLRNSRYAQVLIEFIDYQIEFKSRAYKSGCSGFINNGTSMTEFLAIQLYEREEALKNRINDRKGFADFTEQLLQEQSIYSILKQYV